MSAPARFLSLCLPALAAALGGTPPASAVAWNPSIAGGAKSEDTALVTEDGVEVITRTTDLGEYETASGLARPRIVEL